MADNPRFSILIPAYNVEQWIGPCLDSCLGQTFEDFEIRIHNDGATDRTPAIIASYKDPRINFTSSKPNEGIMTALGHLNDFSGDYVLYLDSDDELDPETLELLNQATLDRPDIGMWPIPMGCIEGCARTWRRKHAPVEALDPEGIWGAWIDYPIKWYRHSRIFRRDAALKAYPDRNVTWIAEDRFWGLTAWLRSERIKTFDFDRPLYWYRRKVGVWDNVDRRYAIGRDRNDRPEDVARQMHESVDMMMYHGIEMMRRGLSSHIPDFCKFVHVSYSRSGLKRQTSKFAANMGRYFDQYFTRDGKPTQYFMEAIAREACLS